MCRRSTALMPTRALAALAAALLMAAPVAMPSAAAQENSAARQSAVTAEDTPLTTPGAPQPDKPQAAPRPPLVTNLDAVESRLEAVLARPEFMRKREQDTFTKLQDLFFNWLQSLPETLAGFPYADQLHRFTYFVMWAILVGVFVATGYWVWRVFKGSRMPLLDMTSAKVGTKFFAVPESYDPRIAQAVSSGAWSDAMLFRWRKFLSGLETKEIVKADRTQTNWEYANQILRLHPAEATRELLLSLVRTYDLYIYGEARLDEPAWTTFRDRVDEAETQLMRLADAGSAAPSATAATASSPSSASAS
ncbi:hypothetical protein DB346_14935 [Verrucomicrobia bacterium LW23]|nr:hypothetical protein DB346_14935 [Verrucomicrobia bacterium LW23]